MIRSVTRIQDTSPSSRSVGSTSENNAEPTQSSLCETIASHLKTTNQKVLSTWSKPRPFARVSAGQTLERTYCRGSNYRRWKLKTPTKITV